MRKGRRFVFKMAAGLLSSGALVLAGCGDSETAGIGGAGGAGSAGGSTVGGTGGTGGANTASFSVTVYKMGPYDWANSNPTPMAGATVAADFPGGERVEGTSGADGQVTFEGVDWSLGTATVTAFVHGYRPVTWVGLTEEDDGQEYYLSKVWTGGWAQVEGTASNADPQSTTLTVTPTVPGTSHQSGSFKFGLRVAPDVPFSVVALQWAFGPTPESNRELSQDFFGWAHVELAAAKTYPATTVDIDLADKLTPVEVDGTFVLPSDPTSVLRTEAWAYYQVMTRDTAAALGWPTRTYLAPGGDAFTFVGQHVVVPNAGDVITAYSLNFDGGISLIFKDGYPEDGAIIDGFMAPPTIITVPPPGADPASRTIEWSTSEQDVDFASIIILSNDDPVWTIHVKPDLTTIEVPELPSTVNPGEVLKSVEFSGTLTLFADCHERGCDRSVTAG